VALTLAVLGATGRMGRLVVQEIAATEELALGAAVASPNSAYLGVDAGTVAGIHALGVYVAACGPGAFDGCDVVIDFSLPEGLTLALRHIGDRPLVSGTTGLEARGVDRLIAHAVKAPVLLAANFSTGVNLLLDLVERAARSLPDYDIEIIEAHHRHKVDAPSGTAYALAHAAAQGRNVTLDDVVQHGREGRTGERPVGQIGMHAIRGGGIVGEHQVWLVGMGERVLLGHSAISRKSFAQGAVRAARWVQTQPPGTWSMAHVLGLTSSPT